MSPQNCVEFFFKTSTSWLVKVFRASKRSGGNEERELALSLHSWSGVRRAKRVSRFGVNGKLRIEKLSPTHAPIFYSPMMQAAKQSVQNESTWAIACPYEMLRPVLSMRIFLGTEALMLTPAWFCTELTGRLCFCLRGKHACGRSLERGQQFNV